ncbi:MAG: hypothetical protein PVJ39_21070 [Gammaproteobacteria bacterium]|jgi:hypothetical protein
MKKIFNLVLLICLLPAFGLVNAEQVTKEQIKGLDEQVQDIKKDVLGISAELNLLEEKLLFPSNTQISFFVSLDKNAGIEPDAIMLKLDEKDVAHHIYSYKEVEALQKGGVQRVFTGNVRTGDHKIQVNIVGNNGGSKKSDSATKTVTKGVGPRFVEIRLTGSGVEFRNW